MGISEINNRAGILIENKKWKKGLLLLNTALEEFPDNPILLFNRAHILNELKEHQLAISDIKKAAESKEPQSEYFALWGLLLYEEGKYPESENVYLSGLEKSGLSFELCNNYGVLLFVTERYEEAEKYFKKALKFQPDNKDARINYADTVQILKKM